MQTDVGRRCWLGERRQRNGRISVSFGAFGSQLRDDSRCLLPSTNIREQHSSHSRFLILDACLVEEKVSERRWSCC